MSNQPIESKTITTSQGWEFVPSDRIQLMEHATAIVSRLNQLRVAALDASMPITFDFTRQELSCYDSALAFLKGEFDKGPSLSRSVIVKFDQEQTYEFEQQATTEKTA